MIELTKEQVEEQFRKKLQAFRDGLEKLQTETGLTIIPLLLIDGKFTTQRTDYEDHILEAVAKVVPYIPDTKPVADKIIENANNKTKKSS